MTPKSIEVVEVNEATNLAKTLANKTAQKIITHIQEKKDITATEIANELNLPLSTVQYNLKALTQAKIINDDSFHYSEKGKVVPHYSPSDKVIIIVPKQTSSTKKETMLTTLQAMIPGLLTASIVALGIGLKTARSFGKTSTIDNGIASRALVEMHAVEDTTMDAVFATETSLMQETIQESSKYAYTSDLVLGILLGIGIITIVTIGYVLIKQHIQKKQTKNKKNKHIKE